MAGATMEGGEEGVFVLNEIILITLAPVFKSIFFLIQENKSDSTRRNSPAEKGGSTARNSNHTSSGRGEMLAPPPCVTITRPPKSSLRASHRRQSKPGAYQKGPYPGMGRGQPH